MGIISPQYSNILNSTQLISDGDADSGVDETTQGAKDTMQ